MVDRQKVATIVKRINTLRETAVKVPDLNEVTGVPKADEGNINVTDISDPLSASTPRDIGPVNKQTISGTGTGPSLGSVTGYVD